MRSPRFRNVHEQSDPWPVTIAISIGIVVAYFILQAIAPLT